MRNDDAQKLAERIAQVISAESKSKGFSSLQKNIDTINERLDKLETLSSIPQSTHPSQDRFAIAEAIVDSLFERDGNEKACTFEPNGKPCDHCSMCSSRGF